jgi:hypothetical protein
MFHGSVAVNHRRCRTLDRELLTKREFYELSPMRPKMHEITAFEEGAVHFALTGIVQMLDHALNLLDVLRFLNTLQRCSADSLIMARRPTPYRAGENLVGN